MTIKKILIGVVGLLGLVFSHPALAATPAEIEKLAKTSIQEYVVNRYPDFKPEEIRIKFNYPGAVFEKLSAVSGSLRLKVLELYRKFDPLGTVVIPIQVYRDNQPYQRLYLNSVVEIYKPVVVAAVQLGKDAIIRSADLSIGPANIAGASREYYLQKEQLIGKQTKTIIRAGKPIYSWMVKEIPLINRGDEIGLVVVRGNVRVRVPGTALGDGYLGQKIKVKRADSRIEFVAIVSGTAEAEVY
jgi:flagella basal body P-ring formation protein FlgA